MISRDMLEITKDRLGWKDSLAQDRMRQIHQAKFDDLGIDFPGDLDAFKKAGIDDCVQFARECYMQAAQEVLAQ